MATSSDVSGVTDEDVTKYHYKKFNETSKMVREEIIGPCARTYNLFSDCYSCRIHPHNDIFPPHIVLRTINQSPIYQPGAGGDPSVSAEGAGALPWCESVFRLREEGLFVRGPGRERHQGHRRDDLGQHHSRYEGEGERWMGIGVDREGV